MLHAYSIGLLNRWMYWPIDTLIFSALCPESVFMQQKYVPMFAGVGFEMVNVSAPPV